MSHNLTLPSHPPLPLRQRPATLLAIAMGRLLAALPPQRIVRILHLLRRGTAPATTAQTLAARTATVTLSQRCASDRGCLQRSLATTVLCRMRGVWPTWCTGIRTRPFSAHAWVAVEDTPVGEPHSGDYYTPILLVPPGPPARPRGVCPRAPVKRRDG
ncbi:lasso peptide biosynthesis B2 protein [Streptomyces sp. NPDC017988]|uniref:lasso peptide biosynthesis B2 protein n=1 Tax=Streptomyces sp. NPDC017988 TaxID=3365025 RepID=UPI0037AA49CC